MKTNITKQGFVLTAVMMLIVIASLVGGAFLISARGTNTTLQKWIDYDECLVAVQAGLEAVNYSLYVKVIEDIYEHGTRRESLQVLEGASYSDIEVVVTNGFASPPDLDALSSASVSAPENPFAPDGGLAVFSSAMSRAGLAVLASITSGEETLPGSSTSGGGTVVSVSVNPGSFNEDVDSNSSDIKLDCAAKATYGSATRAVRQKVSYDYNALTVNAFGHREVFDNAFFIDNHGFFSGVNCDFNGDVRANKDVDLQYSSIRLNGNAYAGGECTSRKLYKSDDWDDYGDQDFAGIFFGDKVRPAEYTDFDRSNPDTYYPQGYAEGVTFYDAQEKEELPFIGPLSDYEDYAISMGGTASDAFTTVHAVWGDDPGEDAGNTNSVDDGCLVLIGTAADPINLNGVVVAEKDIYIGGYFTGQGTLYAGRNTYVIDNLIAVNAPSWPHPDNDPQATAESNRTTDFLGLCAKGSLIFGDYKNLDKTYLKAPHTSSHATDVTDGGLGYVTHYVDGEPFFDGDYTQPDGDGSETRTDGSLRHFYEPILSDADYAALNPSTWIGWFDAVLYANHLISGDFDSNAVLNGAFVCRDEAVKRHGNLAINWDARLGSETLDGQSFYSGLPGMMLPASQPLPTRTILWAEIDPAEY
jgi:hypothetical protein